MCSKGSAAEQRHHWTVHSSPSGAESQYWVFVRSAGPAGACPPLDSTVSTGDSGTGASDPLTRTEPMGPESAPPRADLPAVTARLAPVRQEVTQSTLEATQAMQVEGAPARPHVVAEPAPTTSERHPAAASRAVTKSRTWTRETPPEVGEPVVCVRSSWTTAVASGPASSLRCGSATHPGPRAIALEKANEDFAFHGLLSCRGQEWIIAGVADGVGQSVWPERAARNAAYAFVETVDGCIDQGIVPFSENDLNPEGRAAPWHAAFSERLCSRILTRLRVDLEVLCASEQPYLPCFTDMQGQIVDRYRPDLFERLFYTGPEGHARMLDRWFQSTLLAVALGPWGGVALLLGDGMVRIDRRGVEAGGWSRSLKRLESDGRAPARRVSLWLSPEDIHASLRKVPRRGAVDVGALLMTDGVSKSSLDALSAAAGAVGDVVAGDHPLAQIRLDTNEQCAAFLAELSEQKGAELDNMSISFVHRHLEVCR